MGRGDERIALALEVRFALDGPVVELFEVRLEVTFVRPHHGDADGDGDLAQRFKWGLVVLEQRRGGRDPHGDLPSDLRSLGELGAKEPQGLDAMLTRVRPVLYEQRIGRAPPLVGKLLGPEPHR